MAQARITFPYQTKVSNLADGTEQHDAINRSQLDGKFGNAPGKAPLLGTDGKLPGSVIPASAGTGTVTSVNGIEPDGNGNVEVEILATQVGTLAGRPATAADATLYIVSGDSTPANNGRAFIYTVSDGWQELAPIDTAFFDDRYLRIDSDNTTTYNITMTDGSTITGLPTPVDPSDAAPRSYVDSKNYLSELQDVDLTGLSDGQTIIWNGSAWIPEDLPTGGGGTGPTGPITATEVEFDPLNAFPLTATDVQGALEEVAADLEGKLNKTGGTVTGSLSVQTPTAIKHAATKEYVDGKTDNKLPLAGGTLTGELTLDADPVEALHAATKQYVDDSVAAVTVTGYLPLTGGTLIGDLTLDAAPTSDLHAATKKYVDDLSDLADASFVPFGGGSLTGPLNLWADPTNPEEAATKAYVDQFATNFADLPETTSVDAGKSPVLDGDGKLHITAMPDGLVKSVNGITPDALGAVSVNLQITVTGTLAERDEIVSPDDGTLFIVVGDATEANNGKAYLYNASGAAWVEVAPADKALNDSYYVNADGDTMSGSLTMSNNSTVITRAPTVANEVATKGYVDTAGGNYLPKSGGILTGAVMLHASPSAADSLRQAADKGYVDQIARLKVGKNGDTMSGRLTLSDDPVNALHAATKRYVDAKFGDITIEDFLPLTGGTLSGALTLPADVPNSPTHAATQAYVDGKVSTELTNAVGSLAFAAEDIEFTPSGNLVATDVQGAITEVHTEIGVVNSNKVAKAGDIMTGHLTLSGAPTSNLHAATKKYVDDAVAGATGTGASTAEDVTYDATATSLAADNVQDAVTELDNKKVSIAGDTMTGPLTLSGVPTAPLHATTKLYVDTITTPLASNVANITNELNALSSSTVKSVNGAFPGPDGDVAISLGRTYTGALNDRPGVVPNPADGDLYIVSGNLVDPDKNGTTYIWSAAANNWLEITSTASTENDLRYVQKGGDSMTGDLDMTGSKVINIDTPYAPGDATNKQYVDGAISGSITAAMGDYVSKTVNNIMTAKITSQNPAKPGTYFETDPTWGSIDTYEPQGSGRSFTAMYGSTIEQQYRNAAGDTVGGIYIMSKPTGTLITVEGTRTGAAVPVTTVRPNEVTILDTNNQPVLQTKPEQLTTKAYVDGAITAGVIAGTSNLMSKTVDNVMTSNIRTQSATNAGNYLETNTRFGMINTYENKVPGSAYSFSSMYGTGVELQHRNADGDTISGVYLRARPDAQGGSYITVERDDDTTGEYSRTLINTGTIELRNAAGTPTIPTSPFEATTKAYVDSVTGGVSNDLADTNNALSALSASAVKKVNGVLPGPDGDVAVSLSRTFTGPLNNRPGIVPTPADGDIYIVSGDLVQPENNGLTFIWSASGDDWLAVVNPGAASSDARYLQLDGSTPMTGELDMNDNVITNVGYPLAATDAAHKGYVNDTVFNAVGLLRGEMEDYVPKTGGTMTGKLTLDGAPTLALHAATKQYADTKLSLTGGYVTGDVDLRSADLKVFNGNIYVYTDAGGGSVMSIEGDQIKVFTDGQPSLPSNPGSLTTKRYVDSAIAAGGGGGVAYLPLTGGAMTGQINMNVAPTTANHVTTKTYVDTADALKLNLTGGTLTGNLSISSKAKLRFPSPDLTLPTTVANSHSSPQILFYDNAPSTTRYSSGAGFALDNNDGSEWVWQSCNRGPGDTQGGFRWYGRGSKLMELHAANGLSVTGNIESTNTINAVNITATGTITAANAVFPPPDYVNVRFNTPYTVGNAGNAPVVFNTINAINGQITYTTTSGLFRLKGGRTYHLRAALGGNANATGYVYYAWMLNAGVLLNGSSVGGCVGVGTTSLRDGPQNFAECIYTPPGDTNIFLGTFNLTGTVQLQPPVTGTAWSSAYATIIQLR